MKAPIKIAFIGDIGGQLRVFERALKSLDVDLESGCVPPDLMVVQVGDIARVSESTWLDSEACIALADRLVVNNPLRYFQLFGNHDLAAIGGAQRAAWPSVAHSETIQRWWDERQARLAIGLPGTERGDILVTHAGLTVGNWRRLGTPDLRGTVTSLNEMVGLDLDRVASPGRLVTNTVNLEADTTWAEVNRELLEPWFDEQVVPFQQIIGHAAPWSWLSSDWWPDASDRVRRVTQVSESDRRTTTTVGVTITGQAATIESIDWELGDLHHLESWPLLQIYSPDAPLI